MGASEELARWSFSARVLEGIPVERARVRYTATYAVLDNLGVGLELNPLDEDLGLLVNWRAWSETARRPALVLGTSSDRIGSTSGRAYYATLSKDLENWTDLPIAPYAGATYGEFEDEVRFIGGLNVRWSEKVTSSHLWDGVNLHHLLDRTFGPQLRFGLVAAEQDGEFFFGARVGLSH